MWVSETFESCNFLALKGIALKESPCRCFPISLDKMVNPKPLVFFPLSCFAYGQNRARRLTLFCGNLEKETYVPVSTQCLCLNQSTHPSSLPPPLLSFHFCLSAFIQCFVTVSAWLHTAQISELPTPQAARCFEGGVLNVSLTPSDSHLALCL